jgi:hypothetical protein
VAVAADRRRRTGCPARAPNATRPREDAATTPANSGARAANGSLPASSAGHRPRRIKSRRTRRWRHVSSAVMSASVGGKRWKRGRAVRLARAGG